MSEPPGTISLSPFGSATQKYWDKRYSYFAKWDLGIQTDAEGLFSVKPEFFANEIARNLGGTIILDAFCGIGGSAIGFALQAKYVISVDTDKKRLAMAMHNARLYGVESKIDFLHGDVARLYDPLYDTFKFDALHIDPPWGGPDYSKKESFSWDDFQPSPLGIIKKGLAKGCNIAIGLPVNFSQEALKELPKDTRIDAARDGERFLFNTAYCLTR